MASTGPIERWVAGSKLRSDAISSPEYSIRTGFSTPGVMTSRIPPRWLYSPGTVTSVAGS